MMGPIILFFVLKKHSFHTIPLPVTLPTLYLSRPSLTIDSYVECSAECLDHAFCYENNINLSTSRLSLLHLSNTGRNVSQNSPLLFPQDVKSLCLLSEESTESLQSDMYAFLKKGDSRLLFHTPRHSVRYKRYHSARRANL